jgi:hypothetical protein
MKLKFNDGMSIDTRGPLHTLRMNDGLYVTREGHLLPGQWLKPALEASRFNLRATVANKQVARSSLVQNQPCYSPGVRCSCAH